MKASAEQNRIHYELEKELTAQIMNAEVEDRACVTLQAYDTLFKKITWHSGHLETEESRKANRQKYAPFIRMIGQNKVVVEIGCGNGDQIRAIAPHNLQCYGVDISEVILEQQTHMPDNVKLLISDASNLSEFEDSSVDVVFSNQLIEHLYPTDVEKHFEEISRVLKPGGKYVFSTPSRLCGPHDISRYFDDVATCFHLKEYTNTELLSVMRVAGFKKFRSPVFRHKAYEKVPWLAKMCEFPTEWKVPGEMLISRLPRALRIKIVKIARLGIFIEAYV